MWKMKREQISQIPNMAVVTSDCHRKYIHMYSINMDNTKTFSHTKITGYKLFYFSDYF